MEMGMICPTPMLSRYATGKFHLILSHLLSDNRYFNHYREQASEGAFITLDNSAYEYGSSVDENLLVQQAIQVGAREIVVPDVIRDRQATLVRTRQALERFRSLKSILEQHEIRLMLVPQATSIWGWGQSLHELIEAYDEFMGQHPLTIGIPKHTADWVNGRRQLIERFVVPYTRLREVDVHLLGVGEDLATLGSLALNFSWIRSTDSVKPFVYAYYDVRLSTVYGATPLYGHRPENYFDLDFTPEQIELADHNVAVYRKWTENGSCH